MSKTISLYGFPSVESPEAIKDFVEQYTGEGTVYAVEVATPKQEGSRTYARVQFTDTEAAKIIKAFANDEELWYENSYLKARDVEHDIVAMPKIFVHSMGNVKLNFGCRTSEDKFSVFWKKKKVSVKFGSGLRNFYFFLSFHSTKYKLELSSENMWGLELHYPRGATKKVLLIQV